MSDELKDVFKNEVIRASAGTGKTFELSNRFLRLLASGADCETILATTFTRKGAGEILDRIVQRLAHAAQSESAAALLAEQLQWQVDQSRVQDLLRELIGNLHRLQIGTLDAFFYRIAQAFRLELKLPTQWQIAGEQQIAAMQTKIVQQILRDKDVVTLLHLMTHGEAQRKIADLVQFTVRALYEIYFQSSKEDWHRLELPPNFSFEKDLTPVLDQLLAIDYKDKRQLKKVEEDSLLISAGDFLDLTRNSKLLNKILDGDYSYYKPLPPKAVQLYQHIIDHCRGVVIDLLVRQNASTFDLLDKFGQQFEDEKSATGNLRFDDVTSKLEDFIKDKQTDDFAFRLDHNVNHLLLDEFQDTSIAQWNVIAPFAQRTTEDDSRKSFFCVGYLKQAIFGWRGGVAEIFDTVESNLANMAQPRSLVKSYRSSPVIIDSVNQVFENFSKYQPQKQVVSDAIATWSETFTSQQTARTELPGYFSLEFAPDSDSKNHHQRNRDRNANVFDVAVEKIRQLKAELPPERTIGVLVRKNQTVGEMIYLLRDAGIAASEEGGNLLTDSVAIDKLLALLTLADHPADSIARFTVSHSPFGESLGLTPETQDTQSENMAAAQQAAATIRGQLISSGYGATLEKYARVLAGSCTPRELSRLQQLVQEAFNYEKAMDQTRVKLRPSGFVEYIQTEFKAGDASSATVRVMTIHQSKGLEFDVVVLPMLYAQNGWFSHQSSVIVGRQQPTAPIDLVCRLTNQSYRKLLPNEFQEAFDESERREIRDEICLLYVAMTRAIHATHTILSYGIKADQHATGAVLMATLDCERCEGVALELGDAAWIKRLPDNDVESAGEASADSAAGIHSAYYLPPDATISQAALAPENRSGRGVVRVSPSSLEGGGKIRMGAIFDMISKEDELQFGSLVHSCFEKLIWLEDGKPTLEMFDEHQAQDTAWFDLFCDSLDHPNFKNLLSKEQYLAGPAQALVPEADPAALRIEVRNERPFSVASDQQWMQGVIDRLVLIYDSDQLVAAQVIDFKTDAITSNNLHQKTEFYRPQLTAYRQAVSEFCRLPLEKISVQLAFVRTGDVVDISAASNNTQPNDSPPASLDTTSSSIKKSPKFSQQQQLKLWQEE